MSLGLDPPRLLPGGPPQASKAALLHMDGKTREEGGQCSGIHLTPALVPGLPCRSCSPSEVPIVI